MTNGNLPHSLRFLAPSLGALPLFSKGGHLGLCSQTARYNPQVPSVGGKREGTVKSMFFADLNPSVPSLPSVWAIMASQKSSHVPKWGKGRAGRALRFFNSNPNRWGSYKKGYKS